MLTQVIVIILQKLVKNGTNTTVAKQLIDMTTTGNDEEGKTSILQKHIYSN